MFLQQTIREKVTVSGVGLHTGAEASISFCPAPPDTGVFFVRRDLEGCPAVPVLAKNVKATALATTLGGNMFSVSTVEHCLSSLTALRIDNLYIELSGPEIPICDGSAKHFFETLKKAGIAEQEEPRKYLYIQKPIYVGNKEKHAYVVPYNGLRVGCTIDFSHPAIGFQSLDLDINESTFAKVASARTFGFLKDVEALQAKGLARGGSLNNAIVLDDEKIINEEGLRFPDEFVRHKLLDAVGDIMTLGHPLMGHVVLYKAGHDLMNQLVQKILQSKDSYKLVDLGGEIPQLPAFKVPFS